LILKEIPDAKEYIKYGIPTYFYHENVVHFGASKNHLGFYPTPSAIVKFKEDILKYEHSKGAIQFPYNKEIPYDLIREIVIFRVREIETKYNK